LTDLSISWTDVLQVCLYFIQNPRPDLYIRQLPIEVHTKFIEQNAALLFSPLDFLIPTDIRNPKESRVGWYYLCYDEPLIRMRVLDRTLQLIDIVQINPGTPPSDRGNKLTDISLPVSDFNRLGLSVKSVVIAEIKMNFLTLPALYRLR